jgi:hypothetical protein
VDKTKRCHTCGAGWEEKGQPGTRAVCTKCGAELHVCMNCRFYDEHKPDKCQVPDIDPVLYKDRANFCDEFQFAERDTTSKKSEKDKAKEAWQKLFKK